MLYMYISIKSRVQVVFYKDHSNATCSFFKHLQASCKSIKRVHANLFSSNAYRFCVIQLREYLLAILKGERSIYLSNPAGELFSNRKLNTYNICVSQLREYFPKVEVAVKWFSRIWLIRPLPTSPLGRGS